MRIGACEPLRERTRAQVQPNGDAVGAILLPATALAAYRPFLPRLLSARWQKVLLNATRQLWAGEARQVYCQTSAKRSTRMFI